MMRTMFALINSMNFHQLKKTIKQLKNKVKQQNKLQGKPNINSNKMIKKILKK